MMTADNDPGTTRVMPPVTPPVAGNEPPQGGMPTWLIVSLAVVGGLAVGGVAVWLLMGARGSVPSSVNPPASVVATTSTAAQSAEASNPAETQVTPPPPPPPAETPPEPDTMSPKTPKFKFPPDNYWLSPDDMKVEIRWSSVYDPSGVSYVLEFSEWLGGGAGWTETKRTAPMKRLYYQRSAASFKERYRIIAVDGAGNESGPSAYSFLIQAGSGSEAASLNASYHP